VTAIFIFLVLVFVVSLVARRLEDTVITGPMIFTFAGVGAYFLSTLVGHHLPDAASLESSNSILLTLAEMTLAIVLFSDATRLSIKQVIADGDLPARLLVIGMPLTIVLGTLIGFLMFGKSLLFWEAAILAVILAPTDASLGAVVVNSKQVPFRIREALSVESGLNDGLSMPFFVLFLALAGFESQGHFDAWISFTLMQIGLGTAVGFVIGWVGGKLMRWSDGRNWMHKETHMVAMLALAVLSWGIANSVGGNGFISAFIAGAAFRSTFKVATKYTEGFEEAWGHLLVYFIFFFFGILSAPRLTQISLTIWVYAALSLTVVRMLPVAISMWKAKLRPGTVLYIGWFGPRGLASVVLGMIYLEEVSPSLANPSLIYAVTATVLLSVLAHGISAAPLSNLYARYLKKQPANIPEYL